MRVWDALGGLGSARSLKSTGTLRAVRAVRAVSLSRSASSVGSAFAELAALLLRGYQLALSPLFAALGSQCRFEPSCSQYMIDAVRARGVIVGVGLGLWRLARCNPFSRGGYDPAPSSLPATRPSDQDVSRETL